MRTGLTRLTLALCERGNIYITYIITFCFWLIYCSSFLMHLSIFCYSFCCYTAVSSLWDLWRVILSYLTHPFEDIYIPTIISLKQVKRTSTVPQTQRGNKERRDPPLKQLFKLPLPWQPLTNGPIATEPVDQGSSAATKRPTNDHTHQQEDSHTHFKWLLMMMTDVWSCATVEKWQHLHEAEKFEN